MADFIDIIEAIGFNGVSHSPYSPTVTYDPNAKASGNGAANGNAESRVLELLSKIDRAISQMDSRLSNLETSVRNSSDNIANGKNGLDPNIDKDPELARMFGSSEKPKGPHPQYKPARKPVDNKGNWS